MANIILSDIYWVGVYVEMDVSFDVKYTPLYIVIFGEIA
jgi:hypothetical protein